VGSRRGKVSFILIKSGKEKEKKFFRYCASCPGGLIATADSRECMFGLLSS
jgi:hypothetical protein